MSNLSPEQQQKLLKQVHQAFQALEKMEARLKSSEAARHEPIAVIGAGCRFPSGIDTPEALWQMLLEGRDVIFLPSL